MSPLYPCLQQCYMQGSSHGTPVILLLNFVIRRDGLLRMSLPIEASSDKP